MKGSPHGWVVEPGISDAGESVAAGEHPSPGLSRVHPLPAGERLHHLSAAFFGTSELVPPWLEVRALSQQREALVSATGFPECAGPGVERLRCGSLGKPRRSRGE
jgi:hypothetical protein